MERYMIALVLILSSSELSSFFQHETSPFTENHNQNEMAEFDFIIIGAGSAGSVLANRLSEIDRWRILVLEAGYEAPPYTDIPILAPVLSTSDYSWPYLLEKQEGMSQGLEDERIGSARGKALGGSSVINYMIGVRGNEADYDNWEKMGNPGWAYRDVLKYFIKSEDASIPVNDTEYRGQGGYQSVEQPPFTTKAGTAWIEACEEAGYKYIDYNGREQIGVSHPQSTIRNGFRCSTEKGYLRPIKHRTNLVILTGARVTSILINSTNREAYGVRYIRHGNYFTSRASKEVICSAGAYNSAQLLMLSGIGPKDALNELNITILQNLPVGQKMYDHLAFPGLIFTVNASITISTLDFLSPISFLQLTQGKGPFTSLIGLDGISFIKVSDRDQKLSVVELLFVPGGFQVDFGLIFRKALRITDKVYNAVWKPLTGKPVIQILPVLFHPESYGYLKLRSKNYLDYPQLYGQYFTDPDNIDIKSFVRSFREVERIMSMPAFQKYNARIWPVPIPGCEMMQFDSDEYWECAVKAIGFSLYHQTTTCKMGPESDTEAVVDARLRVHGVNRLRVVDAGVFPTPVAAHNNIPVIMVAEKAADMIKEDWNN